jgi:hypothetical protein
MKKIVDRGCSVRLGFWQVERQKTSANFCRSFQFSPAFVYSLDGYLDLVTSIHVRFPILCRCDRSMRSTYFVIYFIPYFYLFLP